VFSDGKPRFIQIKGINLDAEIGQHMVYTTNTDAPGIIGILGTTLGKHGVNIANFQLGRETGRAATRSRCSMSTNWSARTCWTSSPPTTPSSRPSRWCSTWTGLRFIKEKIGQFPLGKWM
jgi:hypothetical protein